MQLLSDATLHVIANPFAAALDAKGRPCAFVQYDPAHVPRGTVRYVGANIERELVEKRPELDARQSRFETTVRYDLRPQPVVDSQYHRVAIRSGELLAADDETARIVGLAFIAPRKLLASGKQAATDAWYAQHRADPSVEHWRIEHWPEQPAVEEAPTAPTAETAESAPPSTNEQETDTAPAVTTAKRRWTKGGGEE